MSVVIDCPATSPTPSSPPPRRRTTLSGQHVSLALLLVGAGLLYLVNLSANGWANSFYSAAIQAGSRSWKAWFFGSSDMANSITVDKPPMSLWLPAISVRIFGLNSWAILIPQALLGVATVALLYVITKKYLGHWAAIVAGAVLAVTPIAALMFRFNNPDALLVLLMTAAVWATLKAVEDGRLRWMLLTGVLVGFGFLTKQLQVMLVVPPLAMTYLAFGRHTWVKRLGHLFGALAAVIVGAGWWVLTVELWPASSRPWIGGSQHNSILELTFGYNGFGRLNGTETGSVHPGRGGHGGPMGAFGPGGGMGAFGPDGPMVAFGPGGGPMGGFGGPGGRGGAGGGMWGQTGWLRMFQPAQGGQIAWLIPTALILGVAALVIIGKAGRTDMRRAYLTVWGLWLLVTMAVFSFMAGIFHPYYTVALAPAVAAVFAGGAAVCWRERRRPWVRIVLAVGAVAAAWCGYALLGRAPDFVPWLRWTVLIVGILGALALLVAHRAQLSMLAAVTALAAALAGPVAYTIDTVSTGTQGSIVSAGPRVAGGFGPGGGHRHWRGAGVSHGFRAMHGGAGRFGGGLLMGSRPSADLVAKLRAGADRYTWVAAAVGSNQASGYQLATGYSVMPLGGFNGTDPSPTLDQFKQLVAQKKVHYFLGGGRGFGFGGSGTSQPSAQIATWVQQNFTAQTVGGTTLYDLTSPHR